MMLDELACARAQRWASAPTMHGYPALADETETTLAVSPPECSEKQGMPPALSCGWSLQRRLLLAITIGCLSALLCSWWLIVSGRGGADFMWAWRGAHRLVVGQNPYHDPSLLATHPFPYDAPLYYPLPAVLLALPLTPFPAEIASGLFIGLSSALLAFGLTATQPWRLVLFLSAPYWVALGAAQWSPLVVAATLFGSPLLLMLLKPNLGVPALLAVPARRGMLVGGVVLAISLVILPSWPLDWLANVRQAPHIPPLFILPGPILLLAFRWRRWQSGRLLLGMALVPQRFLFYDQLLLWLIPQTFRESLIFSLLSWLGYAFCVWYDGGPFATNTTPYGVILFVYMPALILVIWHAAAAPTMHGDLAMADEDETPETPFASPPEAGETK